MTIITASRNIQVFRLLAVRRAIMLEAKGMKHSRGSVKAKWAKHFGMSRQATCEEVIKRIEQEFSNADAPKEHDETRR